jgi:site-specific DNA recombinase
MRNFFGYIRVSTPRQGQGVSLQAQKDAIERHSQRYGLNIVQWFEERETAAKGGRRIFTEMLQGLRSGKVAGLVLHKIDRGARNLKDWADLGELVDRGVEIHFANESLDLNSRGGRLSADIQAVVAADYIRNLREEVRKGFYGRLKQGLYPLPAPLGYLNKGGGKRKELDPESAPLVKKAFELYASGRYNLDELVEELYGQGLRKRGGGRVTRSTLDDLLKNPFYIGLIRIRTSGETFPGVHEALVKKSSFDRVQLILSGKAGRGTQLHDFLFRRLFRCKHCGRSLSGEKQKGHVYYRCHSKRCPTTGIREEAIEEKILQCLSRLEFSEADRQLLAGEADRLRDEKEVERANLEKTLSLRLHKVEVSLDRLTDAYIDQAIDKMIFERRKNALLREQKDLEENLGATQEGTRSVVDQLCEFFELAGSAYLEYKLGFPEQKRHLLKIITSNRLVDGKRVDISLLSPFEEIANRPENTNGGPFRDRLRTFDDALSKAREYLIENPTPGWELPSSLKKPPKLEQTRVNRRLAA